MRLSSILTGLFTATTLVTAQTANVSGIVALVKRRLPAHIDDFKFVITSDCLTNSTAHDTYIVSTPKNGTVLIQGSSLSALSTGLHRYLNDVLNLNVYWQIGSRLHLAPAQLPSLQKPLTGSSIIPWRYMFNTVTFSYTAAFWSWEDWELELDWLALRGINLPLAWVGYEYILVEAFREIGFTDPEITSFLSGPAFQAWNRFGNIQGSWGGSLPTSWINGQFALQKKIVQRMVELGMTPVLPAFTGFVPRAIGSVAPSATFSNGSTWQAFPTSLTNTTFLDPFDPLFAQLQKSVISKQLAAYGNVTHIYTLDQFNENNPAYGDMGYLHNVTYGTWQSLKAADPRAVWMLQGWLFYSNSAFWTNERIQAFLGGVEVDSDMLILDLFSESQPQWQRTNSYYGKPWIWNELHDYGGNMGIYGQVENITVNPIAALNNKTSTMVGMGLTMEGQEGNEIVYDLLLDQAWQATPIDTSAYFHNWVTARYAGSCSKPQSLYKSWETLRTTAYNNTNLTSNAVVKSIFELVPSTTSLLNRTGHHPTTVEYAYSSAVSAWSNLYNASKAEPSLWDNPAYCYDLVDMTRQVMGNAFIPMYQSLISAYQHSNTTNSTAAIITTGKNLTAFLIDLDTVLLTNKYFSLYPWIASARAWANDTASNSTTAAYLEYTARNQITLWGPNGEISDYASKSWGGLVGSYYVPRWTMFVNYLAATPVAMYNTTAFMAQLLKFEEGWQTQTWGQQLTETYGTKGELAEVLGYVINAWPQVFTA